MKSFLQKLSLISLIALLFCIGFELFLLTVPNEYSYKRKYVEEQGDKIKVLVLGHSHAGNAIIPELLGDSVFNLAIGGRNHYYDAVLAERYIPTLRNLKCVIWPLGYNFQYSSFVYPCTFRSKEEKSLTPTYQCMYEKYMYISYERKIPYWHWSELIHSQLNYWGRIFKQNFEEKNQCTPSGYERLKLSDKPSKWKIEKLPSQINYDSPNAPLALREGLNDLKCIAEVCRKASVRLVVITMPCYQSFIEQTTERGMKEMQECVDSMRSVYPEMEYYNFIDDKRFTEDDFYNSSHLLEEGAEKFSKILKDTLGL